MAASGIGPLLFIDDKRENECSRMNSNMRDCTFAQVQLTAAKLIGQPFTLKITKNILQKQPWSLRQRNEICFNCEVNAFQFLKTTEGRESQTEATAEGSCGKILAEQKKLHFHGAPKKNCHLDDSCF